MSAAVDLLVMNTKWRGQVCLVSAIPARSQKACRKSGVGQGRHLAAVEGTAALLLRTEATHLLRTLKVAYRDFRSSGRGTVVRKGDFLVT